MTPPVSRLCILDPRGPGTGERLFLLDEGFGEGVEDLSVLDNLPPRPVRPHGRSAP